MPPTNCFSFADTFVSRFSFLLQQRYLEAPGANQGTVYKYVPYMIPWYIVGQPTTVERLGSYLVFSTGEELYTTRILVPGALLNAAASCRIESGKRGGCDCWAAGSRPGLPARPPTNLAQPIRMHVPQHERQDCQDCSRGPIIL